MAVVDNVTEVPRRVRARFRSNYLTAVKGAYRSLRGPHNPLHLSRISRRMPPAGYTGFWYYIPTIRSFS
jgi:hypothetical protein